MEVGKGYETYWKALGKFLDNDSKTGMCLEDTIRFFDVRRIFGQLGQNENGTYQNQD